MSENPTCKSSGELAGKAGLADARERVIAERRE